MLISTESHGVAPPSGSTRRMWRRPSGRPFPCSWRFVAATGCLMAALPVCSDALPQDVTKTQETRASLSGLVVDQMGAYIPKAALVLENARRQKRKTRADDTGRYEFAGLPPGDYVLDVLVEGFKNPHAAVTVTAPGHRRDVTLALGGLFEAVFVGESLPDARRDSGPAARRPPPTCEPPAIRGGLGGRVRPPVKLRNVVPQYPPQLERQGIAGRVDVIGAVDVNGSPVRLEAIEGHRSEFVDATLEAVSRWEFAPAYLNCVAVPIQLAIRVQFGRASGPSTKS
jgi:carboxypeptidase family protein/TonB-like protein